MKFEVLISTMNQSNYDLLNNMKISSDCVVINQCDKVSFETFNHNGYQVKWINSNQKGLSKSRNLAIKNSTADICILADDDMEYISNYKENILKQFKLNPYADLIAFQVEGIEEMFKNYYPKPRQLNFITSMKVSSVEIAFKRKSLIDNNIKFNELFGSGSKYYAGEENIFLYDCLRSNLKLHYVPLKVSNLHLGESTWFEGFNDEYFITKGAVFTAMSKLFSIPLILQFALRKRKLYVDNITMFKAAKEMFKGRNQFLNEVK